MDSQALKRPARILCVEDDPAIGEIMMQVLAREGYWVAHSENGRTAWEHLAKDLSNYRVVVTDNQMPHGGGLELVGQLRQAGFPGRIVVHSSPLPPHQASSYRALGVDTFVSKGSPVHELLRAVAFASATT